MIEDNMIKWRSDAYDELVEALRLTTLALERSKTAGAEYRVEENRKLLAKLGAPLL